MGPKPTALLHSRLCLTCSYARILSIGRCFEESPTSASRTRRPGSRRRMGGLSEADLGEIMVSGSRPNSTIFRTSSALFSRGPLVFGLLAGGLRLDGFGGGDAAHALAGDRLYFLFGIKSLLFARQVSSPPGKPASPEWTVWGERRRVLERPHAPRSGLRDIRSWRSRAGPGSRPTSESPTPSMATRASNHREPRPQSRRGRPALAPKPLPCCPRFRRSSPAAPDTCSSSSAMPVRRRRGAVVPKFSPFFQLYDRGMRFHTEYLTFETKKHREYINITPQVESVLQKSGIREGMILVSAMHITAGVWVNDAEDGLIADIDEWLEKLAPFRKDYRHHRTGETNGDSHLKSLLVHHEVIVPVTRGKLDFGPWQQVYYAEFDGRRPKRVIIKAMGE